MINPEKTADFIVNWLLEKIETSRQAGFVVGVSGGIDSATVSTLCARTGKPTIVLNMPIHQPKDQFARSDEQCEWLTKNFQNVKSYTVDLTSTYEKLRKMDPVATWFLHVSKKMLLNGTPKNPKMKPTKLRLNDIIEVLKTI